MINCLSTVMGILSSRIEVEIVYVVIVKYETIVSIHSIVYDIALRLVYNYCLRYCAIISLLHVILVVGYILHWLSFIEK